MKAAMIGLPLVTLTVTAIWTIADTDGPPARNEVQQSGAEASFDEPAPVQRELVEPPPSVSGGRQEEQAAGQVDPGGTLAISAMDEDPGRAEPRASVAGIVVTDSEERVPNATVYLVATGLEAAKWYPEDPAAHTRALRDPERRFKVRSAENGAFRFDEIPYSGGALTCAEAEDLGGGLYVELAPGQVKDDVRLVVKGGATLAGRVLAADGKPVANALVQPMAFVFGGSLGRAGFGGGGGGASIITVTDEQGFFELVFRSEGYAGLHVVTESQGEHTFTHVPVGNGEIVELVVPEPARLRGRITYEDKRPATGLIVYLASQFFMSVHFDGPGGGGGGGGAGAVYADTTGPDGRYEILNIDPDASYEIHVSAPDGVYLSQPVKLERFTPGKDSTWDYVIERILTVKGRVFGMPSGRPIQGVKVSCVSDGGALPGATTDTAADGSYELQVVAKRGLHIITPHYAYLAAEETADTYGKEIQLDSDSLPEINLSLPHPFTIAIRVVDSDGHPVSKASVSFMHEVVGSAGPTTGWGSGSPPLGKTDEKGRFSWSGFAPIGAYVLHADAEGFIRGRSSEYQGESGAVFEDETIVLHRPSGLEGIALDGRGQPIANAMLFMEVFERTDQRSYDQFRPLTTNDEGHFIAVNILPAARLSIKMRAFGQNAPSPGTWRSETIDFPPNQTVNLGEIVFDEEAAPIPED